MYSDTHTHTIRMQPGGGGDGYVNTDDEDDGEEEDAANPDAAMHWMPGWFLSVCLSVRFFCLHRYNSVWNRVLDVK